MAEEKTSIDASIILVKDLIDKWLIIPNYQRPYRWNASNVLHGIRNEASDYSRHTDCIAKLKDYSEKESDIRVSP